MKRSFVLLPLRAHCAMHGYDWSPRAYKTNRKDRRQVRSHSPRTEKENVALCIFSARISRRLEQPTCEPSFCGSSSSLNSVSYCGLQLI